MPCTGWTKNFSPDVRTYKTPLIMYKNPPWVQHQLCKLTCSFRYDVGPQLHRENDISLRENISDNCRLPCHACTTGSSPSVNAALNKKYSAIELFDNYTYLHYNPSDRLSTGCHIKKYSWSRHDCCKTRWNETHQPSDKAEKKTEVERSSTCCSPDIYRGHPTYCAVDLISNWWRNNGFVSGSG